MGHSNNHRVKWVDSSLAWVAILLIKTYQLSLARFHGRICLFEPSCSHRSINFFRTLGFFCGLKETRQQLADCCGNYSMRLDGSGKVELITQEGRVIEDFQINPKIKAKLLAFDALVFNVSSDRQLKDAPDHGI